MNALKIQPQNILSLSNKIGYTGYSNIKMAKDQHGMVNQLRHLVLGPKTRLSNLDCVSNCLSVNQANKGSESHAEKRWKPKFNRVFLYWELGDSMPLRDFLCSH